MRITAYIADWCSDSQRTLRLLNSSGLAFDVIDIEEVTGAEEEMKKINGGSGKIPTIVIENSGKQSVLIEPSDSELKQALGIL